MRTTLQASNSERTVLLHTQFVFPRLNWVIFSVEEQFRRMSDHRGHPTTLRLIFNETVPLAPKVTLLHLIFK